MRSALIVTFATTLLGTAAPALAAQEAAPDGEQVYRQHCARCHEGSMPRMPTRELLRQRTPEDVEIALSTFTMRRQGAALSSAERRAVSEYVTGRPPGSYRDPLEVIPESAYCTAPVGRRSARRTGVERLGRGAAEHPLPVRGRGRPDASTMCRG